MDLALTDDQQSLQEVFADFFAKESSVERVRAAEPLGFDERLWERLVQTGAPVMGVPEAAGGGAASHLDVALVAEELGRRIAPVPLVEVAATAGLLADAGANEIVAAIADGSVVATLAPGAVVGGIGRLVPAGAVADVVVALDGDRLVALRREGRRPYVEPPKNLASAPLADVDLREGWAERIELARGNDATALVDAAKTRWRLFMAAAMVGLGAEAHRIAVEYVKVRKAFDVPLGWFQTIAHRLSDRYTELQGARLLTYEAAWATDEGEANAGALTAMAFLFASERAFATASDAIHFHGGYGYTLEYDIQLYLRRAKAWPLTLGAPRDEYGRLASLLFETEAISLTAQGEH